MSAPSIKRPPSNKHSSSVLGEILNKRTVAYSRKYGSCSNLEGAHEMNIQLLKRINWNWVYDHTIIKDGEIGSYFCSFSQYKQYFFGNSRILFFKLKYTIQLAFFFIAKLEDKRWIYQILWNSTYASFHLDFKTLIFYTTTSFSSLI